MADPIPLTLGQAIDIVLGALLQLDPKNQRIVITSVLSSLGLTANSEVPAAPDHRVSPGQPSSFSPTPPREEVRDIRTFGEQKAPRGNLQMACLVAYYLKEMAPAEERKDVIKGDDLPRYFLQANFEQPKNPRQVLVDAKAAGYFESVNRGEYKLNAVGYNLVTHKMARGASS